MLCIQCKEDKPLSEFRNSKTAPNKTCYSCIEANEIEVQTRKISRITGEQYDKDVKLCTACNTVKPLDEFKRNKSVDGLDSACKECRSEGKKTGLFSLATLASAVAVIADKTDEVQDAVDFVEAVAEKGPADALVGGLVDNVREKVIEKVDEGISDVVNAVDGVAEHAGEIAGDVAETVEKVADAAEDLKDSVEKIEDAVEDIAETAAPVVKGFRALWQKVMGWFK